jgi:hypothetical protein
MSTKKNPRNTLQSSRALKFVSTMQRRFYDYEFLGLDHLNNAKPSILVGNHSIFAYDVAILLVELKLRKNIELRALGDSIVESFFSVPEKTRMKLSFCTNGSMRVLNT